jgi:tetratricopeptide (TPR) repeat protein
LEEYLRLRSLAVACSSESEQPVKKTRGGSLQAPDAKPKRRRRNKGMDLQTRDVMGYVTYAARQYDSAISQFNELNASYPGIDDFGLGWSYRGKKMYPEAIAALQRELVHSGRRPLLLASLASVYGLAGRKREALRLIDELKERSRQHYISDSLFAEAYIGLGEKDEAMSWLERAYEEHDQWMVYIKTYPGWDALRSEPRFQALVRRMNFPP